MKFCICAFIVLTGFSFDLIPRFASVKPDVETLAPTLEATPALDPISSCPNRKKLKNLCMMIGDHMEVSRDPKHKGQSWYETRAAIKYMYEQRFYDAACVMESDPNNIKFEKIRNVWAKYEDDLVCTNTQFDVPRGHLLKYAVASLFDDFLDDVIRWGVHLNKVDETDNMTVLDYVQLHMQKSAGGALEKKLQTYYDKLRKAGAKHRHELKNKGAK